MSDPINNFADLISLYRRSVAIPAVQHTAPNQSWNHLSEHLSWMLDNMPDQEADHLKFQRWLGFVQALLMVTGVYTLDQLREQTRRIS